MSQSNPTAHSSSRKHHCAICSKGYSTNSHLRRHELSHARGATLICPICSRYFSRTDVARRHTKKCSKVGEVIFPQSRRGKKPKACDTCFRRKLSCDADLPCSRCGSAGLECTYYRLNVGDSFSSTLGRSGHIAGSPTEAAGAELGATHQYTRIPIDFLLRFTEPSPYGTFAAVVADTAGQSHLQDETECEAERPGFPSKQPPSPIYQPLHFLLGDALLWDQGECFPALFEALSGPGGESPVSQETLEPEDQAVLEQRGDEIISELSLSYGLIKKTNPEAPVSFNLAAARSVFTGTHLGQFVGAYFSHLHWYIPIIHKPTFRMETTPIPLLLSMFLFGSLCYTSQDGALLAREFFDLAEDYIFGHPTLRKILEDCSTERASIDGIQILQAGLIIEIIQNGSRHVHTRRRLRLERHPSLAAAMRISGIFRAERRFPLHELVGTDWQMFIIDELRLRLAAWMFFTDSNFSVFYNKPPEVHLSEMTAGLPCPEELFEADTLSEYEEVALRLASETACSPSLSELTAHLLADTDLSLGLNSHRNPRATELFFCISALQSTAMATRASLLTQATAGAILNATNRWKLLWEATGMGTDRNGLPLKGFVPHAPELWWLTRAIVRMAQSADSSCRFAQFAPMDSINELHKFISTCKDQ